MPHASEVGKNNCKFQDMKFESRNYQERAIDRCREALNGPRAVHLLHLATGAGKTYIASRVAKALLEGEVGERSRARDVIWITKWELVSEYKLIGDSKAHYGIANADVYQLLAYRELNSNKGNASVAPVYPQNNGSVRIELKTNSDNEVTFSATAVNLGADLQNDLCSIIAKFQQVFSGLNLICGHAA